LALGRTHELINLLALPGFLYFLPKEFYLPFGLGYVLGTFLLSPDLDLKHSKPSKRWKALKILWRPYQKKSKHRGISHIPILGTFTRLLYIFLLITALYYLLYFFLSSYWQESTQKISQLNPLILAEKLAYKEWTFYALLGLIASELTHISLDLLWSFWKRIKPF
jgi:uncharacterized metal-binding protein